MYPRRPDAAPSPQPLAQAGAAPPRSRKTMYPLRPDAPPCQYYLKTGKCNYGPRCKFDHPHRDAKLLVALGRRDCFDYVQGHVCPYGDRCKYNHPPKEPESTPARFAQAEPAPTAARFAPAGTRTAPVPSAQPVSVSRAMWLFSSLPTARAPLRARSPGRLGAGAHPLTREPVGAQQPVGTRPPVRSDIPPLRSALSTLGAMQTAPPPAAAATRGPFATPTHPPVLGTPSDPLAGPRVDSPPVARTARRTGSDCVVRAVGTPAQSRGFDPLYYNSGLFGQSIWAPPAHLSR